MDVKGTKEERGEGIQGTSVEVGGGKRRGNGNE